MIFKEDNMKKITLITSFLVMSGLLIAAPTVTNNNDFDKITTKASNNVTAAYGVDTNKVNYALATKHTAGDKIYATTNMTSVIYVKDGTKGASLQDSDVSGVSEGATAISGWSSL
jgi:hypothetical protein